MAKHLERTMRKNILTAFVALFLCSAATGFNFAQDADSYDNLTFPEIKYDLPEVRSVLLENGIKIYSLPNSELPLFEIFVLFKFETKPRHSLVNALEQISAKKIGILEEKGGEISFESTENRILFSCSVLKEFSDEVLVLVEEILSNLPSATQWDDNFHNSRRQEPMKANTLADIEFDNRLFANETTKNDISKIQPEEVSKVVVGVSGQFDFKKIKASFNRCQNIPARNGKKKNENEFTRKYEGKTTVVHTAASLTTDYLRMGFLVPGINSKDHYALLVINEILNHSLLSELRIKRGLVYSVGSFYGSDERFGKIVISSRVHPRKRNQIIEIIKQLLFQSSGNVEAGLELAKSYLRSQFLWKVSSDAKLLEEILRLESLGLSYSYVAEYFENIERVSSTDVLNLFTKYLTDKNLVTVVLSSQKTISEK